MKRLDVLNYFTLTRVVIKFALVKVLKALIVAISILMTGCAYKLSTQTEKLPGNFRTVEIALFDNRSTEPGVEVYFTNSMKSEALKSRVVTLKEVGAGADAALKGVVREVLITAPEESITKAQNTAFMPAETVLATTYAVTITIEIFLQNKSTGETVWSGSFKQARNYTAPQITLPVVNTTNSLYNQSAKRQTFEALSKDMMQAAFDRMIENF